jgi:hypothetical protein
MVPAKEQTSHGGTVSGFYSKYRLIVIDPANDERRDVVNGLVGVTDVGAQIVTGMQKRGAPAARCPSAPPHPRLPPTRPRDLGRDR